MVRAFLCSIGHWCLRIVFSISLTIIMVNDHRNIYIGQLGS